MPIANRLTILRRFGAAVACVAAAVCSAQEPAPNRGAEVLKNVCGVCHTPQIVVARRRTRAQWQETIDKMISLGAKASEEDFAQVLNYLTAEYGREEPNERGGAGGRRGGRGADGGARGPRTVGAGVGPDDKHAVDSAAADRGRRLWAAECIDCHGTYARGSEKGPNLVRSD